MPVRLLVHTYTPCPHNFFSFDTPCVVLLVMSVSDTKVDKKVADLYYDKYDQHSAEIGGNPVALLMQVGSFYELYSPADDSRGNAAEIANKLNIACPCRKDRQGNETYKVAGFPDASLAKYRPILLQLGYTVFIYDQNEPNNTKKTKGGGGAAAKKTRDLSAVISPSTDYDSPSLSNWTTSVFVDFAPHPTRQHKKLVFIGVAIMDRTASQHITLFQSLSTATDMSRAKDDLVRVFEEFPPTECIVVSEQENSACNFVQSCLGKSAIIHSRKWDASQVPTVVPAELSLLCVPAWHHLCVFMEQRAMTIQFPTFGVIQPKDYLELSSTAYEQLDVPLLLRTVDKTKTRMGSRLLQHRLARPFIDRDKINCLHDQIDELDEETTINLRKTLETVPDLNRLHQRVCMGKATPNQFKLVVDKIGLVKEISELYVVSCVSSASVDDSVVKEIQAEIACCLVLENFSQDNFSFSLFHPYFNARLTRVLRNYESTQSQLRDIQVSFERLIDKGEKTVTLNTNQFSFEVTKTRSELLKAGLKREKTLNCFQFETKRAASANVLVTNDDIRFLITTLGVLSSEFESLQRELLCAYQRSFYEKYRGVLCAVEEWYANLDFVTTGRFIADAYSYVRPIVAESEGERGVRAVELRHPVIERLHEHVKYIPNDIELNEGRQGYVVYGINAGGKTSILKSAGLAYVMAQAGWFVPAKHFTFSPIHRIMTRIAGSDNISRGMSSFAVELEDIKSVLDRADDKTLLLGDEMCRGTEVESANGIVLALLSEMHKRGTFVIAATHLHDIVERLPSLSRFYVCHTHVEITDDGELYYHRKLRDGAGPSRYGIEVARAFDFPADFISTALNFRGGSLLTTTEKKSKYNAKKVVKACQVCGWFPRSQREQTLDTHHLDFQCNADARGFHDHSHVHALHNLVVLCKKCHVSVHTGEINLKMVQLARNRTKLLVTRVTPSEIVNEEEVSLAGA